MSVHNQCFSFHDVKRCLEVAEMLRLFRSRNTYVPIPFWLLTSYEVLVWLLNFYGGQLPHLQSGDSNTKL